MEDNPTARSYEVSAVCTATQAVEKHAEPTMAHEGSGDRIITKVMPTTYRLSGWIHSDEPSRVSEVFRSASESSIQIFRVDGPQTLIPIGTIRNYYNIDHRFDQM